MLPYFCGATRPTIPVTELTAITFVLMLLRQSQFHGTVAWGTDSLYALAIMMLGHGASIECTFVNRARMEARAAKARWRLKGYHTPSHIGYPPNECVDVLACMGRLRVNLLELVAVHIAESVPPIPAPTVPINYSIAHAHAWAEMEDGADPLLTSDVKACKADFCIPVCASANVLTLHPAEEMLNATAKNLDSHRGLDLASQFAAAKITVIGLQETRLRIARAFGIGHYLIFAAAANAKGQGWIELWVLSSWVPKPQEVLVLFASPRILIVRVSSIVRVLHLAVAHALDSSYLPERFEEWWANFRATLQRLLVLSFNAIWMIDAHVTVGARQSEAIGPHHPEKETTAVQLFRALLLDWKMALPATVHHDDTGAATWQSTAGTRKRNDFVAMPRKFVASCTVSRSPPNNPLRHQTESGSSADPTHTKVASSPGMFHA